MSGFKTHLYGGIISGAATSIYFTFKLPSIFTSTQLLGIFFTGSIGGLIPDLDSNRSKPFSMLFTLLSLGIPIFFFKDISIIWLNLIPYFEHFFVYLSKSLSSAINFFPFLNLSVKQITLFPSKISPFPTIEQMTPEFIITYFLISYVFIRYLVCKVVKRLTVHRGIMHSIPFAILCAESGFLIFIPSGRNMAIAVAVSIFLGCMSHLILDELNSITFKKFIPKLKKSAGTALKFRSRSIIDTIFIYTLVIVLAIRIIQFI